MGSTAAVLPKPYVPPIPAPRLSAPRRADGLVEPQHVRGQPIGTLSINPAYYPQVAVYYEDLGRNFDDWVATYGLYVSLEAFRSRRKYNGAFLVPPSQRNSEVWVHPSHQNGNPVVGLAGRYYGGSQDDDTGTPLAPVDTEWAFPLSTPFTQFILDINPDNWLKSVSGPSFVPFPILYEDWDATYSLRGASNHEFFGNTKRLVFRLRFFTLDPLDRSRRIHGPPSEPFYYYPKVGNFLEGRYFYCWKVSLSPQALKR